MTPSLAAPLFSLLGNERRLKVVLALRDSPGGASITVMSPILDIPEPQLSDLCSELVKNGLATRGRAGRHVLFRLNQELLNQLAALICEE
jgi:DNA-binding transcriptional ArsR family regulator